MIYSIVKPCSFRPNFFGSAVAGVLIALLVMMPAEDALASQDQEQTRESSITMLLDAEYESSSDVQMMTLDMEDIPLSDALELLANEVGVGISYQSGLVPGYQ